MNEECTTCPIPTVNSYMYDLKWRWSEDKRWCVFIMLNPARTDRLDVNPTVLKCKAIAKNEGCGGMILLDLFPYVAGNSKALAKAKENEEILSGDKKKHKRLFEEALKNKNALIIAAWGENRKGDFKVLVDFDEQIKHVKKMIRDYANTKDITQLEKVGEEGRIAHPVWLNNEYCKLEKNKDYKLTRFDYSEQVIPF